MTDDFDVLTQLADYHDHIAPPTVPVADDVRRGRRRIARNRGIVAGGVALGVAAVVLTASLVTGGDPQTRPEPADPSPTNPALVNGRITNAPRYFGAKAFDYQWRSFDPASGNGLYVDNDRAESVTVIGESRPIATLTCPDDLTCLPDPGYPDYVDYAATLGPGADEVTVESGDRTLQVVAYDGTMRRTIDLTESIKPGDDIRRLAWSSDGSRLAVGTGREVWLVRQDGETELSYSTGSRTIWALAWSPDGQRLLLDENQGTTYGADVVVLRPAPEGSSPAMTEQSRYHSDRHFDWAGNIAWSPDGTRIAVRSVGIVEISPEDGQVLATHPRLNGWLIWPTAGRVR